MKFGFRHCSSLSAKYHKFGDGHVFALNIAAGSHLLVSRQMRPEASSPHRHHSTYQLLSKNENVTDLKIKHCFAALSDH